MKLGVQFLFHLQRKYKDDIKVGAFLLVTIKHQKNDFNKTRTANLICFPLHSLRLTYFCTPLYVAVVQLPVQTLAETWRLYEPRGKRNGSGFLGDSVDCGTRATRINWRQNKETCFTGPAALRRTFFFFLLLLLHDYDHNIYSSLLLELAEASKSLEDV